MNKKFCNERVTHGATQLSLMQATVWHKYICTLSHRHTRIWKMQAKLSIGVTVFIARCCLWSEDKSGSEIDLFVLITRALTHPPSGGILDSRIKGTGTHFYNPICRHVRGNVSPSGVALFASMLHLESIFFCNSPSVTSWKKKQNKNRGVLVLEERPDLRMVLASDVVKAASTKTEKH